MPSNRGPEYRECQLPACELLTGVFGYTHTTGEALDAAGERSGPGEVLLLGRLESALRRINPGLSDAGVRQAIEALRLPAAIGVLEANEKIHGLLSRWAVVEEVQGTGRDAKPVGRSVRYIDYDNPANNDLLIVEELPVRGPREPRRVDIAVYANGIPLVVIECKDPADPHAIAKGVGDLLTYQDRTKGVPRLFHFAQICMALAKHRAVYGTVETPMQRYAEWKRCYPMSIEDLAAKLGRVPTAQDVLLAGMLAPENLLDLVRTFTAFDRQGGRTVRKLARYQQFEAVNEAVRRILDPRDKRPVNERGGVIWHTQGSGKSLTMLWLAVKLRRAGILGNPTLLIVTDRTDLDRQITETFQNCGFENPVQASRVKHLRQLLATPGQTVMTTVQKFREDAGVPGATKHPVLSRDSNIFVLVDEAHRTEYGYFNANLRRALPNACFIAFTGTPIPKTLKRFGGYIHKYTMPQSVADGATVPILYESRLPERAVWGERLDPIFEEQFADLTEEQREELKRREVTARRIAETPDRIEAIAFDIARHYRENFEPDGFKAQVAACSQEAAAQYYRELAKYFPDRVALLIAEPGDKGSDLRELTEKFGDEREIIRQFVHEDADRLAIIVVVDKYLTGFDAPVERVLYLDKPLRDHGLLQAIARVNRPLPEKNKKWGLIVDYWGVAGFLPQALAVFDEDLSVDQVMEQRENDAAARELRIRRAEALECFPEGLPRDDIEPWLLALEADDARAVFVAAYRAFFRALERVLPDPRGLDALQDFAWLQRVRREMVAQYSGEDLTVADYSERVRELINKHVRTTDVRVLLEPMPILSAEFEREVEKLASPRARASRMEHAIGHEIGVKMAEDPAFYESIRDRLERLISERRQERLDDAGEYRMLLRLREDLAAHGSAGSNGDGGLPEAVRPFRGLLTRELGEGALPDDAGASQLAGAIHAALDGLAVIDWTQKEDVQREMRRAVKRELRLAGVAEEKVEQVASALMDLARARISR